MTTKRLGFVALFVSCLLSKETLAGGPVTASIAYSPVVAVPALSSTMLIALALLLPVIAFRFAKSTPNGKSFQLLLPWVLVIAAGISGYPVIKDVLAAVQDRLFLLSIAAGGTTPSESGLHTLIPGNVYSKVQNTSGVNQQINSISVSPSPYFTVDPSSGGDASLTPRCLPGTVLTPTSPGNICYIAFGVG